VERVDIPLDAAKFDLVMYVERRGPDLGVEFVYRTDLLAPQTVAEWARSFRVLLDGLLDRPDRAVTAADLLDDAQRRRILDEQNRTGVATPTLLVPDLIARRAAERPAATALVAGDTVLTYRELLDRADRLAALLRDAGVRPEIPVGLCLPRSVELAVATLAVLRAGGAYVPLDPQLPPSRVGQMLADAGARLVLATGATAARLAVLGVPVAVPTGGGADLSERPEPVEDAGAAAPGPENTAYILFTSGSTGAPKGVAIEHRALANLATAVGPQLSVSAGDRVLQYGGVGFDVVVSDLFMTWVAGGELHLPGEHERLGDALYARLRDSRITYVLLPPVAAMSMPCPPGALPDLRTFVVGGEPCPPEFIERWSAPGRRVVNAYGPTETTVCATIAEPLPGEPVTIGRPLANTRTYVLDDRLRPVPAGVAGEIYIAGTGVGRGYASRPGMTAERFVADPFGPPGSRMYRTGDLGRYAVDGALTCLGRTDSQVKVRGFRVELVEIETVLASHPRVAVAAATVAGEAGQRRLLAYLVGTGGTPPGSGELRSWLAERLPAYMVPETIVYVDELPVGPTGKVDRARLPEPPATRPELRQPRVAPASATEHRVAEVWARVLGLDRPGVHDNFFDLGGNSILLLSVLTALREQGDTGLSMVDLFQHPTIAALAERVDRPAAPGPSTADRDASRRRGQDRRERLAARAARVSAGGDAERGSTT
jgi:amino acid adenylation domain-containing protein